MSEEFVQVSGIDALAWEKQGGLMPAIVQDVDSLRVLMLGYMSRESLKVTLERDQVTFFSRSKQRLWTKGEISGHVLDLVSIQADCDNDSLLVLVRPRGPTCHTGEPSCFANAPTDVVAELDALISQRKTCTSDASYTRSLFDAGVIRIAQKVGEEGVEAALAGVAADDLSLCGEAADLTYHLLVLLQARGLTWQDVRETLSQRGKA